MTTINLKARLFELLKEETMSSNKDIKYQPFLIVTAENPYDKLIITAIHHNVALLKPLKLGDEYEFEIQLKGKEWTNKAGLVTHVNNFNLISVKAVNV